MVEKGLYHSGLPLGGIGTGSVELRADGYFHEWQIMNNRPWGDGPSIDLPLETSFFAVQVHGAGVNRTAILGTATEYNWILNDPYAQPWMEYAESIDADIRMPFTNLRYNFIDFPVEIALKVFSPFIPHDSKNSGLPLAYFTFTIKNLTTKHLTVSLLHVMKNITGYERQDLFSKMDFQKSAKCPSMLFSREAMEQSSSSYGTLAIGAFSPFATKSSFAFHPLSGRDFWEPLHNNGRLENIDRGNFQGALGNVGAEQNAELRKGLPYGALCQTISLRQKTSQTITSILAWHFPSMIDKTHDECKGKCIGHRYNEWFDDAPEVLAYGYKNYDELYRRTKAFSDSYYTSSLEPWCLDAISAQLTTLIKASWWDRQGRFGIWEGLGCCGLQTTDVTYYGSFPLLTMFPDLQLSSMRLTKSNIPVKGKIPHMMPGNFSCCDPDHRNRIDLVPQFILLVWRDVLWTADKEYAREMWPVIEDSIAYALEHYDTDKDGLLNNSGPDQTYDQFPLKGTSAFVGFIWAASLRAASELAQYLGKTDAARAYADKFANAIKLLEQQLWTGTSYRLSYDPVDKKRNDGIMADQVNGDWFVRQSCDSGILPDSRVVSALRAVVRECTGDRGFISNSVWPKGGAVKIGRWTADQANWPWSGVEFALASHLALMGLTKEALKVMKDVWGRYERAGLRFNHIECGQHYYRAMSSWAAYMSIQGLCWNAIDGILSVNLPVRGSSMFISLPSCWGVLKRNAKNRVSLFVRAGHLELKTVVLKNAAFKKAQITLNRKRLSARIEQKNGRSCIVFDKAVDVKDGRCLPFRSEGCPVADYGDLLKLLFLCF